MLLISALCSSAAINGTFDITGHGTKCSSTSVAPENTVAEPDQPSSARKGARQRMASYPQRTSSTVTCRYLDSVLNSRRFADVLARIDCCTDPVGCCARGAGSRSDHLRHGADVLR